ncbi:Abi family protein [Fructobacillus sp. M158]|uniref:Abi family protein n=1 Tax=Fructobacillus parabroussonetiae TaxID=2713174 RepID=UPI00200AE545|nr:Abi family protein [Fructobacillus parabroussonetiae]MCK8617334.1 Abi family protein [Fructobacillus parabroussonetiae]
MDETIQRKEFKTLDEQINILKDRNLTIIDEEKAKEYLLSNNYYNIINGYSIYFKKENSDQYLDGTTFDEITSLYFFESELKRTVFNSLLLAEKHLKSIFSYRFSETYENVPYAYLDINCYAPEKTLSVVPTISLLSKTLQNNQKYKENPVHHYVHKYKDVPIWVLINFIDFGTLKNLINNVTPSVQNKIAKDLSKFLNENVPTLEQRFNTETMLSLIKNVHETRNVCAHNNRLLDFSCRSDSIYFKKLHEPNQIGKETERRKLYSTLVSLQCFLSKTEYAVLHNTIIKRIKYLNNNLKTIDSKKILSSLGFPEDFELETIKQN